MKLYRQQLGSLRKLSEQLRAICRWFAIGSTFEIAHDWLQSLMDAEFFLKPSRITFYTNKERVVDLPLRVLDSFRLLRKDQILCLKDFQVRSGTHKIIHPTEYVSFEFSGVSPKGLAGQTSSKRNIRQSSEEPNLERTLKQLRRVT